MSSEGATQLIQTLTYNQSYSIIYIITNYLLLVVVNKVIFQENMYKTMTDNTKGSFFIF